MPFPITTGRKLEFKVEDIGISSEKLLLKHIVKYLGGLGFGQISRTDNKLIFHKGGFMMLFRRKDFVDNGKVKVKIKNNRITVKIQSLTVGMFLFASIFSLFMLFDNPVEKNYPAAIWIFIVIFGLNYIIRAVAVNNLANDIEDLILKLNCDKHSTNTSFWWPKE
ncbi:MAG: hypothetical protein JEY96_19810 [Bacteroidales bacterium]|nr:hypothetical protein [Bacteroidales bacterium]